MPDRTPKDSPQEHPALPAGYAGAERRAGGTELHRALATGAAAGAAAGSAVNTSREPEWQRDWPSWAKLLYHLGPFSIICVGMVTAGGCFMRERATDRANDRADRMEEREIRRAENDQHRRHNDAITAKFDALVAKIDAAMERGSASAAEMRAGRAAVERVEREIREMMERLLAELKRLVPYRKPVPPKGTEDVDALGFLNPILWLADHAPPKVMPGPADLAPSPRPCDAQSTGGAAR